MGDFTGWSGATSKRTSTGINLNQMVNGISPPFHIVTSQGYDPKVGGNILPMVGEGNHSFRLGDNVNNTHGDRLSYTFTVTSSNAKFGFMYAMVLEDGEHSLEENPFFSYIIQKGNNPNIISFSGPNKIIQSKQIIADKSNPFFKKRGNIVWKDWSYECIDLSSYIGEIVTISFYAADCAHGGHFGYAYIDGLCSNPAPVPSFNIAQKFCYSSPITMDATASTNEDSYFLSVQEADQWWNIKGPEIAEWFVAKKAGVIDLKAFMQSHGMEFKCNTYYRVKLAVSNTCVNWVDLTKLIYITCPQMNIIPDVTKCCSNPNQINYALLGPVTNNPNTFITWQPSNGVYQVNSSGQSAGFLYNQNGYVDVTVTDVSISFPPLNISFCSISQRVNLLLQDDFTLEIDTNRFDCCKMKLTAKVKFKNYCNNWESLPKEIQNSLLNSLDYSWSTGEKTPSITVSGASKEYTVTVNSKCKSYSASYFYHQSPAYSNSSEYDVIFTAPNALVPGNQGLSGKLVIMAGTYDAQGLIFPNVGTNKGIYKSQAIRLTIFNRWGEAFWMKTFEDCGQLYQGDIYWDGKDNNGNYVPTGAYVYKIEVQRCGEEGFKWYCNDAYMLRRRCAKKLLIWCLKWEDSYEVGATCGFWINVIH